MQAGKAAVGLDLPLGDKCPEASDKSFPSLALRSLICKGGLGQGDNLLSPLAPKVPILTTAGFTTPVPPALPHFSLEFASGPLFPFLLHVAIHLFVGGQRD